MSEIEYAKSNNLTLFLPAFIDDYGFTPEEFRIFARIMRRAVGAESRCYESIPKIAETTGISQTLVRRALNVLIACKAVTRTVRAGKSDLLDFNTCDKWLPPENLPAIRKKFDAEIKAKDRARKRIPTPVGNDSGYGNDTTPLTDPIPPPLTDPIDEGISLEGNPSKGGENAPARAHDAPETEKPVNPKSASPSPLPDSRQESFAASDCEQVKRTIEVIGFVPCIDLQTRIEAVVPRNYLSEWINLVENRIAPIKNYAPKQIEIKISYWLGDFQNDLARRQTQQKFNASQKPDRPKFLH